MIDWTEIKAEYHQKVSAESAENGVDTEDLPITDNTAASVIAPEEKRKNEFAKVGKRIILRNTRLERWLNCWLEYLRDGYKAAASSSEKELISVIGKLWQGVLNEVHGVYNATIPTNELLNLLDYCDLELASNDELKDEVSYNREFLIHVTKSVLEGVIAKYPAIFNQIEENQIMPLEVALEIIRATARRNASEQTFSVEDILKFTGGVIYSDKSGVGYLLSYDVVLMVDIFLCEDGEINEI